MQIKNKFIVVLICVTITAPIFVFAATKTGIAPDSTFYFFDRFFEKIDLFFTFNPETKVKKNLSYAEERLSEAEEMATEKKPKIVEEAMAAYEENIATAIESAKGLPEKQKSKDTLTLISDDTSKHEETLKRVLAKVPDEAKPAIEKAIEVSTKRHEQALQEVEALKRELGELKEELKELKQEIKELRKEQPKPKEEEKEPTAPLPQKPEKPASPQYLLPPSTAPAPTSQSCIGATPQEQIECLQKQLQQLNQQVSPQQVAVPVDPCASQKVDSSISFWERVSPMVGAVCTLDGIKYYITTLSTIDPTVMISISIKEIDYERNYSYPLEKVKKLSPPPKPPLTATEAESIRQQLLVVP